MATRPQTRKSTSAIAESTRATRSGASTPATPANNARPGNTKSTSDPTGACRKRNISVTLTKMSKDQLDKISFPDNDESDVEVKKRKSDDEYEKNSPDKRNTRSLGIEEHTTSVKDSAEPNKANKTTKNKSKPDLEATASVKTQQKIYSTPKDSAVDEIPAPGKAQITLFPSTDGTVMLKIPKAVFDSGGLQNEPGGESMINKLAKEVANLGPHLLNASNAQPARPKSATISASATTTSDPSQHPSDGSSPSHLEALKHAVIEKLTEKTQSAHESPADDQSLRSQVKPPHIVFPPNFSAERRPISVMIVNSVKPQQAVRPASPAANDRRSKTASIPSASSSPYDSSQLSFSAKQDLTMSKKAVLTKIPKSQQSLAPTPKTPRKSAKSQNEQFIPEILVDIDRAGRSSPRTTYSMEKGHAFDAGRRGYITSRTSVLDPLSGDLVEGYILDEEEEEEENEEEREELEELLDSGEEDEENDDVAHHPRNWQEQRDQSMEISQRVGRTKMRRGNDGLQPSPTNKSMLVSHNKNMTWPKYIPNPANIDSSVPSNGGKISRTSSVATEPETPMVVEGVAVEWADLYDYTRDGYSGYVTSYAKAMELFAKYELTLQRHFVIVKQTRNFQKEISQVDALLEAALLLWGQNMNAAAMFLDMDDNIPFIICGSRGYNCDYGPLRPDYGRRRPTSSKNDEPDTHCRATVQMRVVIKFTDYKDMKHVSLENIQNACDVAMETRYYVGLSRDDVHNGHEHSYVPPPPPPPKAEPPKKPERFLPLVEPVEIEGEALAWAGMFEWTLDGYWGYVSTYDKAIELLGKYEDTTLRRFVSVGRTPGFNKPIERENILERMLSEKPPRVVASNTPWFLLEDAIPYIYYGRHRYVCLYGHDYNHKVKERRRSQGFEIRQRPPCRKIECPARCHIRIVVKFTDYRITEGNTVSKHWSRLLNQALRIDHSAVAMETRYYLQLARESEHKDHPKCPEMISRLTRMANNLHRCIHDPETFVKKHRPSLDISAGAQKLFNFNRYTMRHVALKIVYVGWDYHGFVVQEDSDRTIEAELFQALQKTCLIENRETCNYHRCGRTDKGVSAFSQVVSLDVRSNLLEGEGVKPRDDMEEVRARQGDKTKELQYVKILNRVLPPEIRVIAWAPVSAEFSARFDCTRRVYKYFFPVGNLNVQAMANAAVRLIGEHDFRNLCKMDVGNGVVNYRRRIDNTELLLLDQRDNGYQMCELTITGQAFLWHQIRCIMSVLFMVGEGKETPLVIESLLDVENNPQKPQYTMASELPLVLFSCEFEDFNWIYEADDHIDNIKRLQELWAKEQVKSTMLLRMLEELQEVPVSYKGRVKPWKDHKRSVLNHTGWLIPGKQPNIQNHRPLMKRPVGDSLDSKVKKAANRKNRKKAAEAEAEAESSPVSLAVDALTAISSDEIQVATETIITEECDPNTKDVINQILVSMSM